MKRIIFILFSLASIQCLTNCISIGNPIGIGPVGMIFTLNKIGSSGRTINAPKTGRACSYQVLGLIAAGNASVEQAALDGQITNIATIDKSNLEVLLMFVKSCTVVTGQ